MASEEFYEPGDIIYKSNPNVQVILYKFRNEFCDHCCKRSEKVKLCGYCNYVGYCSKECKTAARRLHGAECHHLKQRLLLHPDRYSTQIRFVGKVFLLLQQRNGKFLTETVLGTKITIGNLFSSVNECGLATLYVNDIVSEVRQLIGDQNVPNNAWEIAAKAVTCQGQMTEHWEEFGYSLCLGIFAFSFSCLPNAGILRKDNYYEIRATQKIPRGEVSKIFLPRTNLHERWISYSQTNEREPFHDNSKSACSDCSLPYGESILTKTLDPQKSAEVVKSSDELLKSLNRAVKLQDRDRLKQSLSFCLKSQEGVLGDTNTLRMELFYWKIVLHGDDVSILQEFGQKLFECYVNVYGERSLKVFYLLAFIADVFMLNKKLEFGKKFIEMRHQLAKVYGMEEKDYENLVNEVSIDEKDLLMTLALMKI